MDGEQRRASAFETSGLGITCVQEQVRLTAKVLSGRKHLLLAQRKGPGGCQGLGSVDETGSLLDNLFVARQFLQGTFVVGWHDFVELRQSRFPLIQNGLCDC